ncbi:MAG: hypothetical protein GY696_07230 [Gammaproteobacteria bacterium]|nr:hypothetical protein [Gammaproteobacteria bacterium]
MIPVWMGLTVPTHSTRPPRATMGPRTPTQLTPTQSNQLEPTAPMTCYVCGQAGHMKQVCPLGGAYNARGRGHPAGTGRGRGGYPPKGSYNQSRGLHRRKMTCFKCLN